MCNIKDLTGMRFGRLLVIRQAAPDSKGRIVWECLCDCGKTKEIRSTSLCQGLTKSCGCIRHCQTGTRLYSIWAHMIQRCENAKSNKFSLYGGRGISVCKEWRENFMEFKKWACQNGYFDNLSIDRIDNNRNYSPDNCRWSTPSEQNSNRRPYKLKNKRIHKKAR